jgi:polysaccharide biosynthesis PFTS motif protein
MPFTSTAIIAKELGKPSIFYDASASIEKNESHGIPVLKNKEELKNWYRSLNIDKVVSS